MDGVRDGAGCHTGVWDLPLPGPRLPSPLAGWPSGKASLPRGSLGPHGDTQVLSANSESVDQPLGTPWVPSTLGSRASTHQPQSCATRCGVSWTRTSGRVPLTGVHPFLPSRKPEPPGAARTAVLIKVHRPPRGLQAADIDENCCTRLCHQQGNHPETCFPPDPWVGSEAKTSPPPHSFWGKSKAPVSQESPPPQATPLQKQPGLSSESGGAEPGWCPASGSPPHPPPKGLSLLTHNSARACPLPPRGAPRPSLNRGRASPPPPRNSGARRARHRLPETGWEAGPTFTPDRQHHTARVQEDQEVGG